MPSPVPPALAARLSALGLEIPKPPAPAGAYVPAVEAGGLVYVSGQLPIRDGALAYRGKVGADLDLEAGRAAAALCFLNALAAFQALFPLERLARVVRLTGHVQCAADFHDQPKVINGASELAQSLFGEAGVHSRAALGAYSLPLDAAVELEAIFRPG